MEVKNWEVKEQFRFPQSFGIPKEIKTVKVTPQYEHNDAEETLQTVGIYHITCYVKFEEGEHAHHATSDFTQIEDLDVQGELGYFEYAVPMSVEISKQKIQAGTTPTLSVQDVNSRTTEHEGIEIMWTVNCEYETVRPQKVEKEAVVLFEETDLAEPAEEISQVAKVAHAQHEETTEQAEQQVAEGQEEVEESELQFILNLDDGHSKVTYPSNYVSIKQKADEQQ